MTNATKTQKALQADRRQARLAAQLRSNLKKRKQQARERTQDNDPARTSEGSVEEDQLPGRTGGAR